jgi:hypothetical protein
MAEAKKYIPKMSSNGEFKRRVAEERWLPDDFAGLTEAQEKRDEIVNADIVNGWIDEAKKEFPMITDEKYRMYAQPRQYFELEQDRRSWFKKWFGEP